MSVDGARSLAIRSIQTVLLLIIVSSAGFFPDMTIEVDMEVATIPEEEAAVAVEDTEIVAGKSAFCCLWLSGHFWVRTGI